MLDRRLSARRALGMERKRETEKMEKGIQASEGLRFGGFKNSSE